MNLGHSADSLLPVGSIANVEGLKNPPNAIGYYKSEDAIADKLVAKFKSPASRKFYCLAAKRLTEHDIDRMIDYAFKNGRQPARMFNWLVRDAIASKEQSGR